MKGITITDEAPNGCLAFDLRDILAVVGEPALRSTWRIANLECTGDSSDLLEEVSDLKQAISGAKLVELANRVLQVIDGTFFGYLTGDTPWIVIQAVDSSAFDVFTDREDLIDSLRAHFKNIAELPPDATPAL